MHEIPALLCLAVLAAHAYRIHINLSY